MCKLEGIFWVIIKSEKPISKDLEKKLSKIRHGSCRENIYSFYYTNEVSYYLSLKLLKKYRKRKFEVVRFTDKQFGLTVNYWKPKEKGFVFPILKLPLKKVFLWFTENQEQISITPITTKQFNEIVYIN